MTRPIMPDDCDIELTKEDFDRLARGKQFAVGPYMQDQPDEYGAPYIAPLWLFGQLKDGRTVKARRFP